MQKREEVRTQKASKYKKAAHMLAITQIRDKSVQ